MSKLLLASFRPLVNQALAALLASVGGHEIVAARAQSAELITAIAVHAPDLVLLDAKAQEPEVSGWLMETVLAKRPEARILVLADQPGFELVLTAVRSGAVGVLSRSVNVHTSMRAIQAALEGEGVVPRAMLPALFQHLAEGADEDDPLKQLSPREREVLALMGLGLDNGRIAAALMISPNTVRTHIQHVLAKLDMHSKLEAVTYAMEHAAALRPPGRDHRR
jgi:DNA-binding NarL/FixJ family response regulator